MSGRGGGRPAPMPSAGYRPQPRLVPGALRVRFVAEGNSAETAEFDFGVLPVAPGLQSAFAQAFAARVGPGGGLRALGSARHNFRCLRSFIAHLAGLARPPAAPEQLSAAQLRGWALTRQNDHREMAGLKRTLREIPGLNADFAACLNERNPSRRSNPRGSYSRDEFQRIVAAARDDVRRAARRIRENRHVLQRWRAGEYDEGPREMWLRGELLDYIDRHVDVPRSRVEWSTGSVLRPGVMREAWARPFGGVLDHIRALHLSARDAAAFVVLLVALTGQNKSTIVSAPAMHHRADGYSGGPATAVVGLDKPRRGRRRHMDVAWAEMPRWLPTPTDGGDIDGGSGADRIDLRSAFGVYMLLHDLATSARAFLGTDNLLVWWGERVGARTLLSHEHVTKWAKSHGLTGGADAAGDPLPAVTLSRLRLTFTELHQRPVAHTEQTLANEYLARDRGNISEYQRVVADALTREVAKAATREKLRLLSTADVDEARQHPARVAAQHGMDAQALTRLLAGELDTVVAGCIDNSNSPHAPAGHPCRASFMLCLSCPCARATPQHLPLQVVLHDELLDRRVGMTPLRWTQRYALAHGQLADLLERAGPVAVTDARAAATPADRQLIGRFLNRELDLP